MLQKDFTILQMSFLLWIDFLLHFNNLGPTKVLLINPRSLLGCSKLMLNHETKKTNTSLNSNFHYFYFYIYTIFNDFIFQNSIFPPPLKVQKLENCLHETLLIKSFSTILRLKNFPKPFTVDFIKYSTTKNVWYSVTTTPQV